ncbi:acetyl-CoA C-acyltransferase family protein [Pseudomonas sp. MH9.2]|uniref:acetyl-CoA C-acyltransferase family protein n=1 Tax=unclassified Pseudomonas TaxID=196821 RepID=UPI002AC9AD3C|nr:MULTISPECIES: acetyl-CoA C-acyltransferase family protein [unclassified Pseudomonas]MEB0006641.1 acetyl-CoA C-acyltransferase family protein [Pseudomonas sp. RTB2]MEB0015979.1 acetyl-CoA C-acyltransferase family protein [Pseudomonas sp. RTB3]MEB0025955.1 acetyl-CoA C-acyltransferase family protein [Pseudomonas sp. MH9.2]MEB0146157.1 acetyl-CoA C-acyltransferase family protein [Pseudomonas sp. CCC2.2]MEB0271339.1 acetyl-CoA C-acyltransferase family protein [Pseudomonas sp. 5B4]
MNTPDIYVVGAARTAIGTFGGSLKDVPMADLATTAVKAALQRSGVDPAHVEHVVMGNVIPTEPQDAYISRVAAMNAGIPKETPAYNVNRLCGSGLQAIISAAQTLLLGDAEIAIGAGVEAMSRGLYILPAARWGARMGNTQAIDYMLGILHDPFQGFHMGITAENIAERHGISREMQDALAMEDQTRAFRAIEEGRFIEQIAAVEIRSRKGTQLFNIDEHPRATSLEQLAQMKPAFKKDGSVTAGNASGLNDGAAALVMATGAAVKANNLRPLARLVAYAHAGVEPELMGLGPIPATRLALKRAGLTVADLDVIEANIAFAAQACAVTQELNLDPAKVNPNGSGIALGHPVGATGAIIATKAIHELHRIGGRYALVTMCIGGGQGIAAIFERV